MKPTAFEYHRPEQAVDAVGLLATYENAIIVAGNQTLGMDMAYRDIEPDHLIDIGDLDLSYIEATDDAIEIGATSLHHQVANSETLSDRLRMLAEAGGKVAGPSVRNVGTFGGSLGKAHPASNYLTVLRAMDARLSVRSTDGIRTVGITSYLSDGIANDELIENASIPVRSFPPAESSTAFIQLKRAALTWPTVNACAAVCIEDGVIVAARIGLANVAPHHIRVPRATEAVVDTELSEDALDAVFDAAVDVADPESKPHADAEFKTEMAGEYATRALETAYERALESESE